MPTRRSNRLRAAAEATTAIPATPDVAQIAPAFTGTPSAEVQTDAVSAAANSRRARRLAAAGTPAAQPMTAPAEVIVPPVESMTVTSQPVAAHPVAAKPVVAQPVAVTKPAIVAEPVAAKPAVAAEPVAAPKPVIASEPVAVAEPIARAAETVAPAFGRTVPVFGRTAPATPKLPTADAAPEAPKTPTVDAAPKAPAAPAAPASDVDAFALASDAFGFSAVDDDADAPASDIPVADVPVAAEPVVEGAAPEHLAPRRPRRTLRRIVTAGASFGVMGIAGLIAVSMTLPVSAVAASQGTDGRAPASLVAAGDGANKQVADDEIQAYVASSDIEGEALTRSDAYSTVSLSQVAAEEGIKFSESLYTNDPDAAIQWPFIVGVAMSSPYGQRWGRLHAGIDLVPGNGAPIQAIADGVVRTATESGGAYGVTVYIDHVIDGQVVTSHYAHMQHGSLQVQAGQKVKVGDIVGKVGNTGRSYGAHLHFEIIINGSQIDPLPWMRKNAGRYEY